VIHLQCDMEPAGVYRLSAPQQNKENVMRVQADYVVNVVGVGGITSVGLYQVSSTPLAYTVACHTMSRTQRAS